MNKFFYRAVYFISNDNSTRAGNIFFASHDEVTPEQIKIYIRKKLKQANAVISLRSINIFPENIFISMGGDPNEYFE